MNDLTLSLVVIVVVAILIILIFVLIQRNRRKQESQMAQMALEHGWRLELVKEGSAYGQRIYHHDWTIELLTSSSGKSEAEGSSNVTASTIWKASAPGSTVLIGPMTTQINLGGLGETITRQLLQIALGDEASGLQEAKAGSEEFRNRYMIWAKDPQVVERMINPFIESTLLSWVKYAPFIKRTSQELSVELRNTRLKKPDEIITLVKLGEFLLAVDY